jgi:mono/diheme cytochrome c family protein
MLLGRLAHRDPDRELIRTSERLQGTGLSASERQAILAWIASLTPPFERERSNGALERGNALFHSEEVGCSSCHVGEETTDRARHDIGRGAIETPSLRFVGQSAPYLHNGRYATLLELFAGTDGKMGHTGQLTQSDREALAAYVASIR